MLEHLEVENLALIKNCALDFYPGLTCITGETGAGKSLLLTAIRAITGAKLDANLLCADGDLKVAAEFTDVKQCLPSDLASKVLASEAEFGEDSLIITRKLTHTNRNRIYINNELSSLTLLRQCGTYLADIHSQNEQQELIKPERHLEFLDQYAGQPALDLLNELAELFKQDQVCKQSLQHLIADPNKREAAKTKLTDMLSEIQQAKLKTADELDLLLQKRQKYEHLQKLLENLQTASAILDGTAGDSNASLSQSLQACYNALQKAEQISPKLETLTSACSNVQAMLNDLETDIQAYLHTFQYQPEQVKQLDERLNLLNNLISKYAPKTMSLQEVMQYESKLTEKLQLLDDTEATLKDLLAEHSNLQSKMTQLADKLHAIRLEAGQALAKDMEEVAHNLALPNLQFVVSLEKTQTQPITVKGYDKAEFLLSANLGQTPKPLAKVASGGESSRIFLALKVILAQAYKVPLLLFDEIDQGISGLACQQVAQALKQLSLQHQVICISHQPAIVAQAEHVYTVTKTSNLALQTTESEVSELNESEILGELSRLLVAQADSTVGLKAAKELRKAASDYSLRL